MKMTYPPIQEKPGATFEGTAQINPARAFNVESVSSGLSYFAIELLKN
jgi:hypothetical protein